MKVHVDVNHSLGAYRDPTCWQNSTLRYVPPEDFPPFLAARTGRAKIMRTWITLDEFWDYRTDTTYPDYEIGKARYPVQELHYAYDWASIVPAPSGTRFEAYLTSHSACADELLLNVRRYEREVSDGVISYEQYEDVVYRAVEHCKRLAPNIRYIECCNEVDISVFGLLKAEEYVRIYLCTYRAVKRLNEKYHYDIPLEIGGYAAAHPLTEWKLMEDVMKLLKESEIGERPMDFYSYHLYSGPMECHLIRAGEFDTARLGGVEKLQLILEKHRKLLAELDLPDGPVFLNELGKARTTGVDADALYNAAGVLTYLIASSVGAMEGMYLFPWCTFHNPQLQMSYTQYLLTEDGSYLATPNGLAIEILHGLSGDRLESTVTETNGPEPQYRAIAVRNGEEYQVLCINPTGENIPCIAEISGLPDGEYTMDIYRCNYKDNNCVTGIGNGTLQKTAEAQYTAVDGSFRHLEVMERDNFVLLKIRRK